MESHPEGHGARLDIRQPHELLYWSSRLGVSVEGLIEVAEKAGTGAIDAIEQQIRRDRPISKAKAWHKPPRR